MTATVSHIPAALAEKRRATSAAHKPSVVREGVNFDSVAQPDGSIALVDKKASKPRAAAKAPSKAAKPAGRTDAAKAADKARTLDRIDPERMRSALDESGLTIKEGAAAVGRSVSLVRGWLGTPGQIRSGRPTNPPLAASRLKEVEKAWMSAGKLKAKAAAKKG